MRLVWKQKLREVKHNVPLVVVRAGMGKQFPATFSGGHELTT